MTENFCYNQIGINHILKQFGDAISNKQYKNPIPYDTYRKIRNGFKNIFILVDRGDILVKAESETLFHTSFLDDGFGQFFYDNYVSTTKTVETKPNIKENDTMKTVFAYEVVLYDTDQDNRGHFFITSGLSFADNFGEAAAILESTYGEMLKSIKNLEFIHDDQNVITLPRDIIRTYIDREKFINEIPCDSEGRELATLNQNASKANDNW